MSLGFVFFTKIVNFSHFISSGDRLKHVHLLEEGKSSREALTFFQTKKKKTVSQKSLIQGFLRVNSGHRFQVLSSTISLTMSVVTCVFFSTEFPFCFLSLLFPLAICNILGPSLLLKRPLRYFRFYMKMGYECTGFYRWLTLSKKTNPLVFERGGNLMHVVSKRATVKSTITAVMFT